MRNLEKSRMRASILFLVVGLVGLSTVRCGQSQARLAPKSSPTAANPTERPQAVVTVERIPDKPTVAAIEATGTALAARDSTLSSEVGGTIAEILVQRGQQVRKGQVLLKLDPANYRLGVQQAEASLTAAKASETMLKNDFARLGNMKESGSVSESAFDKVKAQYEGAVAQVAMATAALEKARKSLADSEIRAPYNGSITQILKEVGETVTVTPPTMLIRIVDSSMLAVQVFLPEKESPFVRIGQEARIQVDTAGVETSGEVEFVSGQIQSGTQTFEVRIRVDNRDGRIKAGAFTRATIERTFANQAVLVPATAVRQDSGGTSFVFTVDNGVLKKVAVTTSESIADRVAVKCCLQPGMTIVTAASTELVDGETVTTSSPAGRSSDGVRG